MGLPRAARRAAVDLIHAPAYTAPLVAAVPTVLTIHDVSYERHPEWYPYRRDRLRRAFYRRSARAAAHVLTDSEFSREEIAAAYGIPLERITVAPLGAGTGFGEVADTTPLPNGAAVPYLLHVGDLHERRNLMVVAQALIDVRRRLEMPALSLVLAGIDRGVGDRLIAFAATCGAPDAIVRLGAVSEPALRALYHDAAALVYPSRYEGFGLPLVEAMASGTPVLAARAEGETRVTGARELRVKESDRIASIVNGLSAMGAEIEALPDGFVVRGPARLAGARLDAAGDHRIGMALAVAASVAEGESVLEGAEWVDVSYPGFFEALAGCAASTPASRRSA